MKKLLLFLFLLPLAAWAQSPNGDPPPPVAVVCVYNNPVPSPTTGQFYYAQCDQSGNMKITGSGTGGSLTVADPNNAAFQGVVGMTVGVPVAAQRSVAAKCTVAGTMSVTFADGSTYGVPVVVGLQTFPFAVTMINPGATTATCTYANLK